MFIPAQMAPRARRIEPKQIKKKHPAGSGILAGFLHSFLARMNERMNILRFLERHVLMFMSNKDLPPYGKVFAWAVCAAAWLCVIVAAVAAFRGLFQ